MSHHTLPLLITLLLILLLTILPTPVTCQNCPNGRRQRRSWHDMSVDEQVQYGYCVRDMYSSGQLWRMCRKHRQLRNIAHGVTYFLPFHRCFLREWELLMDTHGCQGMGVPYWDASLESTTWPNSPIWTIFGNLGGNVQGTGRTCINSGWFNGFLDDSRNCVTREASGRQLRSSFEVGRFINEAADYEEFNRRGELRQHADVHIHVGGHMRFLTQSACDPLFYSHHAAIDYYWTRFQARSAFHYTDYPDATNVLAPGFESYGWTVDSCIRHREYECWDYVPPGNASPGANVAMAVGQDEGDGPRDGKARASSAVPEAPEGVEVPEVAKPPRKVAREPTIRGERVVDEGDLSKRQEDDEDEEEDEDSDENDEEEDEDDDADDEEASDDSTNDDADVDADLSRVPSSVTSIASRAFPSSDAPVETLLRTYPAPSYIPFVINPSDLGPTPFAIPQRLPRSWCLETKRDCREVWALQALDARDITRWNKEKEEEGGLPGLREVVLREEVQELEIEDGEREDAVRAVWDVVVRKDGDDGSVGGGDGSSGAGSGSRTEA